MTWQVILTIIATAFLTGLGTAIFNWICSRGKKSVDKQRAVERGLQALLRNNLYQLYEKCAAKGFVTKEDLNNFEFMYEQYHNLGKNGVMDKYYEDFKRLPIHVSHQDRQKN